MRPRPGLPLFGAFRTDILPLSQDYKLRAKDHKKKQIVLKSLRQKAAERNEDEFYFGMVSRGKLSADRLSGGKRWTGTVAGDRGNKSLDMDTVRLLKTQDIGYLRTARNVVAKEVADLEQRAVIAGAFAGIDANQQEEDDDFDSDDEDAPPQPKATTKPKKIVFAASVEEREEILPEEEDDMDMDDDDHSDSSSGDKDPKAVKRAQNAERLRRRLQNAKKKLKALTEAENELEIQRARMAKTATVGGTTKAGKKIKIRERKR